MFVTRSFRSGIKINQDNDLYNPGCLSWDISSDLIEYVNRLSFKSVDYDFVGNTVTFDIHGENSDIDYIVSNSNIIEV